MHEISYYSRPKVTLPYFTKVGMHMWDGLPLAHRAGSECLKQHDGGRCGGTRYLTVRGDWEMVAHNVRSLSDAEGGS